MPKQVEVLVKDISKDDNGHPTELHGTKRVLTYKSFLYLNANPENLRYEHIGELSSITYDNDGSIKDYQLNPGNPNLDAQYSRVTALQPLNVVPAGNTGPSERELQLLQEIERLKKVNSEKAAVSAIAEPEPQERKKPGPKPKAKEGATA